MAHCFLPCGNERNSGYDLVGFDANVLKGRRTLDGREVSKRVSNRIVTIDLGKVVDLGKEIDLREKISLREEIDLRRLLPCNCKGFAAIAQLVERRFRKA